MESSMIPARCSAALVTAVLLAGAAQAQELKTIKIGVVNLSTDIAFYIAEKRGYFKAEGLKADFAYFDSGAKMIPPLGSGALDAGGGATSAGLYNAVERGIEFRVVADKGMSVDGYDYKALVVRKDLVDSGAFKSLADLKGKRSP
jgi:NitT/TauT family transport system substrate-binding protein